MLINFPQINAVFAKNILIMDGYYVDEKTNEVFSGSVLIPSNDSKNENLDLCFATVVDRSAVLRTGHIDTLKKAKDFILFSKEIQIILNKKLPKPLNAPRIVCENLNAPSLDLLGLYLQGHYLFRAAEEANLLNSIVHLSTPTDYFFALNNDATPSVENNLPAQKLAREYNTLSLMQYALWMAENIEDYFKTNTNSEGPKNEVDIGFIEFSSICQSNELLKARDEAQQFFLKGLQKHEMNDAHIAECISAISKRLEPHLIKLFNTLLKIEDELFKCHHFHENLLSLRRAVFLFRKLLHTQLPTEAQEPTGWAQQVVLHQLLNDEFSVISSVNCSSGYEKSHLVFGFKIAAKQIEQKSPLDLVIDVSIHWEDTVWMFNSMIQKRGYESFRTWFSSPPHSAEEVHLHRRAATIYKLRNMLFRILMDFCLPIQQLSEKVVLQPNDKIRAQKCYLNILPSFLEMVYDEEETDWLSLVLYDEESGQPLDLYPKGYSMLEFFMHPA